MLNVFRTRRSPFKVGIVKQPEGYRVVITPKVVAHEKFEEQVQAACQEVLIMNLEGVRFPAATLKSRMQKTLDELYMKGMIYPYIQGTKITDSGQ